MIRDGSHLAEDDILASVAGLNSHLCNTIHAPQAIKNERRTRKNIEETCLKTNADHCLFCKIAARTEPAALVHEDELSMSFMDIHPLGTGHVLVIPKQHAQKLEELDSHVQEHLFTLCNRIVAAQRRAGLGTDGTHFLLNDGAATNQHIPHVHFHLVPRTGRDSLGFFFRILLHFTGLFGFRTPAQTLQDIADRIRRQLQDEQLKEIPAAASVLATGVK